MDLDKPWGPLDGLKISFRKLSKKDLYARVGMIGYWSCQAYSFVGPGTSGENNSTIGQPKISQLMN